MPRIIPKRARTPDQQSPQLRPFSALRVCRTFACEGHRFEEGTLVSPDSPLVQAIIAEHPTGYFKLARHTD